MPALSAKRKCGKEDRSSMGFELAEALRRAVEVTARKMDAEHLQMCAIPDSPGMTLFRHGSTAYKARCKQNPPPELPIPVVMEGCVFIICVDDQRARPGC